MRFCQERSPSVHSGGTRCLNPPISQKIDSKSHFSRASDNWSRYLTKNLKYTEANPEDLKKAVDIVTAKERD